MSLFQRLRERFWTWIDRQKWVDIFPKLTGYGWPRYVGPITNIKRENFYTEEDYRYEVRWARFITLLRFPMGIPGIIIMFRSFFLPPFERNGIYFIHWFSGKSGTGYFGFPILAVSKLLYYFYCKGVKS